MSMKPVSALLVFSLASLGAAFTASAEPAAEATEVRGTLNLNVGRSNDQAGRLIVGSGASAGGGGLIIAPGSMGASFEDVPDLGIQLQDAPETTESLLDTKPAPAPSDEDAIVRLPD
jgi:hypothetical protein